MRNVLLFAIVLVLFIAVACGGHCYSGTVTGITTNPVTHSTFIEIDNEVTIQITEKSALQYKVGDTITKCD